MPAIAPFTAYPSTLGYVWGCPTNETGITMESYEQHDQVSIFEQRNNVNTVVEAITHDPRSEITVTGQTTAAIAQMLGLPVSIANLVITQMGVAGLVMCTGVQYTNRRDANQTVRISARHYPLIVAPAAPTISSLSPNTTVHGGAQFTLTVNGTGYVNGAVVSFAGLNLATTFVSATQLTAIVPATSIATAGTAPVIVTNPGGIASTATNFTIT